MELISTITVGAGGTTAMEFANVNQSYTDLLLIFSLRGNAASVDTNFPVYFNLNGTGYTFRFLSGTGSSAASSSGSGTQGALAAGANATSNTFSSGYVYIPNYAGNTNKSYSMDMVSETNATNATQVIVAANWANTAAITNVSIQGSTIQQFSTASLYGILKGSGGATVS